MGRINWGRVVLGGVLAGVVIGVFNAILIPMIAETMRAAMEPLGGISEVVDEVSPMFLAAGTLLQFGVGIVTVWLYAAIRPRYGPGPLTAAIAGVCVWLVMGFQYLSFAVLTNLSLGSFLPLHGPYVVVMIVSAIAGAWVYKEGSGEEQMAGEVGAP